MPERTIWIYGAIANAAIIGGSLLAFPGPEGRHLAGITLTVAGLSGALRLLLRYIL